MHKNKNSKRKNWIMWLILGGLVLKLLKLSIGRKKIFTDVEDNFKKFVKEQEGEVEELGKGKESVGKYCHNATALFCDYFIPNEANGHKPKILRARSLAVIVIGLMLLKVGVIGYLFFVYPNQGQMQQLMTKTMFALTNQDRTDNGLPALNLNPVLSASAQAKADDMIMNNYFDHTSPDGKKPWDWINRDNYAYIFVGENLAMNFATAADANTALMQSPTHRENILNTRYQDIGLAVASGEINGHDTNVLVEMFAARQQPSLALATTPVSTAGTTPADNVPKPSASAPAVTTAVKATSSGSGDVRAKTPTEKFTETAVSELASPEPTDSSTPPAPNGLPPALIASTAPVQTETASTTAPAPATTTALVATEQGANSVRANAAAVSVPAMEQNLNTDISYVTPADEGQIGLAQKAVKYSGYFFIAALAFMILALLVNIFVRLEVQHRPVIIQTLLVIIFIIGLITVHFNLLETIANKIAIL